jgi:hypothetical protein
MPELLAEFSGAGLFAPGDERGSYRQVVQFVAGRGVGGEAAFTKEEEVMQTGCCKHFTGSYHNTHCQAGVCYRDVTTEPDRMEGSLLRLACFSRMDRLGSSAEQIAEFEKRGTCEKYQEPTAEEIAAYEAEMKAHMDKYMLVTPLINEVKREHKGKGWTGVKECPVCKGELRMSHSSYNGHVHGRCETEGCLAWME